MSQLITIAGRGYTVDELRLKAAQNLSYTNLYEQEFWSFLAEWFADTPHVSVQTSGSTGRPKRLYVKKEHMVSSALMTLKTLGISPGDNALLCLSAGYIAGKMMVVRALVGGLNLTVVEPSGTPTIDRDYQLCAMVPMQVYNLVSLPDDDLSINRIGQLIIGGSPITSTLRDQIKTLTVACYSTYGMTETVSHVALRRLNGSDRQRAYYPLDGIRVSLNESGCLVITAPSITDGPVVTNDLAEIAPDGGFRILGRIDNVINTGGVKVIPEDVEAKLSGCTAHAFAVSSIPDDRLGEKVVLVVEGAADCLFNFDGVLRPYERPKAVIKIDKIPVTVNGKIDRVALRKVIRQGRVG